MLQFNFSKKQRYFSDSFPLLLSRETREDCKDDVGISSFSCLIKTINFSWKYFISLDRDGYKNALITYEDVMFTGATVNCSGFLRNCFYKRQENSKRRSKLQNLQILKLFNRKFRFFLLITQLCIKSNEKNRNRFAKYSFAVLSFLSHNSISLSQPNTT